VVSWFEMDMATLSGVFARCRFEMQEWRVSWKA
jgi:hypothetical protein